ncbi:hypothetical protein BV25DRAFT_1792352 [Artomyces pyxidatus]|uniref:Uncharacterized protein n=1 Tax=Artomyces pyxidatus TaxID=48021 RepID=A0ACB8TKP2_9AGAM|nr:hypothetical protein BV25DRAFT_1792352 [Artomyces pyxidatus]
MADDEDDYLSDKYLQLEATAPSQPKTYHDKRKEALKRAQIKNEQNRTKSRRQLELESREEGLSKSLFERANEEQASGSGPGNKALAMMMKMGFKPGQSLGKVEDNPPPKASPPVEKNTAATATQSLEGQEAVEQKKMGHIVQPLPLNEWAGKKGIGLGKRAASPTQLDRLAKLAKVEDEAGKESFRDRARREFEQRRAEGRLAPAQRTCTNLDESAGITFNVLWLNPHSPESFPEGLLDALADAISNGDLVLGPDVPLADRLRAQMRKDALQALSSSLDDADSTEKTAVSQAAPISPEVIEEASQFLQSTPQERLQRVVRYLRDCYSYCFWCGTQYDNVDEMVEQCPGPDEDMHD